MGLFPQRKGHFAFAVIASLIVTVVSVVVTPTPANATIVPGKHRCVATAAFSDYRGVHCADLDIQDGLIWPQGQSLCQRVSDAAEVRCAGIKMYVDVYDMTDNLKGPTIIHKCGRFTTPWHSPACPSSGRFVGLSLGLPLVCGNTYRAEVFTEFVLPVSAEFESAPTISSGYYTHTVSGC